MTAKKPYQNLPGRLKRATREAFLEAMPRAVVDELLRRSVGMPYEPSPDFRFKIAESPAELEQSFRLVYDSYHKIGYCSLNEEQMRATIHHALPTTTTLLAFYRDEAVGTLTLVRDCAIGLPLERAFEVSRLRGEGKRIAEVTSLVIRRDFRRKNGGQVLFPLLKLMYEYATTCFGVQALVAAVAPKDRFFYQSLLLFKQVADGRSRDYLGAPAVCLQLDLQGAADAYRAVYARRDRQENLHEFFINHRLPHISLPRRSYFTINDPVVSMEYFRDMFVSRLRMAEEHGERRRIECCIANTLEQHAYPRIEVEMQGVLLEAGKGSAGHPFGTRVAIKDVSHSGFRAVANRPLTLGALHEFAVSLARDCNSIVQARVVRIGDDGGTGFALVQKDEVWERFIQVIAPGVELDSAA